MGKRIEVRELLLFIGIGFLAYWFANSVLWIPWKLNEYLGIGVMIILVPILWGKASLFCLNRVEREKRGFNKYIIGTVFLIIGIISDFYFFCVWRGIPNELYKPTTFAAYALTLFTPIVLGKLNRNSVNNKAGKIEIKNLIIIFIIGFIFFGCTLFSVRYW